MEIKGAWTTITSHLPLVMTLNWWKEKNVENKLQNWKHNVLLTKWYKNFTTTIWQTSPKGLAMVRRHVETKTWIMCQWICPRAICEQIYNSLGEPIAKFSKWKQSCKCSNIILEGPLVERIKSWFEWIERKVEIIIQFIIFNEKGKNFVQFEVKHFEDLSGFKRK